MLFLPETYGPVILKKYAQQMRKATGNPDIVAPIELEKKGAKQMVTVTLMRPIRMLLFEAIVLFSCLYLSLAYAIFYMFFEAYPIIFQGELSHDIHQNNTNTDPWQGYTACPPAFLLFHSSLVSLFLHHNRCKN